MNRMNVASDEKLNEKNNGWKGRNGRLMKKETDSGNKSGAER